jgi:hypothetical protein
VGAQGEAAEGGQHEDRDREDHGRPHRGDEGVGEDRVGDLRDLLRDRRGDAGRQVERRARLAGADVEAAPGGVAEAVHEGAPEGRRQVPRARDRLLVQADGQPVLEQRWPSMSPKMTASRPPVARATPSRSRRCRRPGRRSGITSRLAAITTTPTGRLT